MKTASSFALLAALLLGGCGEGTSVPPAPPAGPAPPRVLLVGIDGATWSVARPLMEAGQLPRLARMVREGASGVLESDPPMASPAIWTSIATGRARARHGIEDFVVRKGPGARDVRLVTSRDRRAAALWNLLGVFDRTVGFAGWWASWPAEPVRGWIVSDRFTRSRWAEWVPEQHDHALTWPESLAAELSPLIVDPDDPPIEEIRALVPLNDAELQELRDARKPIYAHGLSVFKFAYCAQRTYERIALRMLAAGQPDLTGVFLIAADPISHTFWHDYEPARFPGQVDPETAARRGVIVPNIYRHNDRYLAELLAAVDPATTVIVVSDHGFEASGEIPQPVPRERFAAMWREARASGTVAVGQSGKHHPDGVLVAWGPAIRKGVEARAHVFDVTPTVLALLGLPVPEDLDGRILTEIIEPAFLEAHPIHRVPSLEAEVERVARDAPAEMDDAEALEKLRSLGYVQ